MAPIDVSKSVAGVSANSSQLAAETPVNASLRREAAQMTDQLVFTELEAESFAKDVQVDAMEKARALLADQRANFERTANQFEEHARDVCENEVAQRKAELTSGTVPAPQQKDDLLNNEASSFADLRHRLSHAQKMANEEAEQKTQVIGEARNALNERHTTIVKQAETTIQEQSDKSSNIIRELRARLTSAKEKLLQSNSQRHSAGRNLQQLQEENKFLKAVVADLEAKVVSLDQQFFAFNQENLMNHEFAACWSS